MKKFSKFLALCFVLIFLIVCMALGGCKKTGAQEPETDNGSTATTTTTSSTTTTGQNIGATTSNHIGNEVVLPDDDGDVVIGIESIPSSSAAGLSGTQSSSGTSKSQSSTNSSQDQISTNATTTYSRYYGETPIFGTRP